MDKFGEEKKHLTHKRHRSHKVYLGFDFFFFWHYKSSGVALRTTFSFGMHSDDEFGLWVKLFVLPFKYSRKPLLYHSYFLVILIEKVSVEFT